MIQPRHEAVDFRSNARTSQVHACDVGYDSCYEPYDDIMSDICQWTYPAHLVFRCFSEEDNNNLAMRTGRAWTSHSSTARVLRAPASPAQVSVAASTRAPRRAGCNALHRDHATPRTRDTSVSLAGCARSAALAAPRHFPSLHLPDSHSLSHTSSPPRAQLRLRDVAYGHAASHPPHRPASPRRRRKSSQEPREGGAARTQDATSSASTSRRRAARSSLLVAIVLLLLLLHQRREGEFREFASHGEPRTDC